LHFLVLAIVLVQPLAPPEPGDWLTEPGVARRLAAGEVVVQTTAAVDPAHPRGGVRAAVWIKASRETIWSAITDCAQALSFVPGLRRCRAVAGAPDGHWQDIEQELRYAWFLPTVRYVFHAEYDRPRRIDFRRVSGDLKEQQGTWLLSESADGATTAVQYEMYLDPGFWVPQALVARMLRTDLPAALRSLRQRVESAGRRYERPSR
jgi:coenzyme Q-binding protein COQ10